MTRKDFELIARAVRAVATTPSELMRLSTAFAEVLTLTNPRFDRVRFLKACRGGL